MPTIQQQINQLKKDKETLNTMLNTMGVETTGNETFTELTPLVGKIVTDPILQDKSVEITENGTTTITADEGYDGLNNVEVITNVAGGGSSETTKEIFSIDDFYQLGSVYDTDGYTMTCTSNRTGAFNGVCLKEIDDGTYYITTTTTKGTRERNGFWHLYKYDGTYFHVLNLKEGKFYKLSVNTYLSSASSDGAVFRQVGYDEIVKIVVVGNSQVLYVNDEIVATIINANTIGSGSEGSASDGTNFTLFTNLYKEIKAVSI